MRKGLIAIGAMLVVIGQVWAAEEITSGVIHNYNLLGLGYGYLHEIGDSDINAHGAVGSVSYEEQGVILSAGGNYFWGDEEALDLEFWSASVNLGYVVRLMQNHINIIPNVGGSYSETEFDAGFPVGTVTEESWSIFPGIGVSFAPINRLAVHGAYAWGYNFDTEEDDHFFSAGATFALLEKIGLTANANFSKEFGFTGVTAGVEFHY